MPYTHSARLDYGGALDDVFDSEPREVLPTCPSGPIRLYGKFRGKAVRVDACSDGTAWVFARSQREANGLARRMERKSIDLAEKLLA